MMRCFNEAALIGRETYKGGRDIEVMNKLQ